jgi:thiamine biosynthesis protein ThiI
MRRMMYRIAERVAKNRNCTALVSGESVGQVASQTLESMATINEVIKLPMIRPLAVMDKVEIIAIAEKIKTFEISIRPFIDCCTIFNPVSPVTKPRVHIAKEMEERFDYEQLVYDCVNEIETITIDANVQQESEIDKFF